jgi:pSer/pThr/pTyr-binding forkhead associated (FHA) protein
MANKKNTLQPALILMYGVTEHKYRALDKDAIIVGRARGCDIGLEAPDISNLHCVITRGIGGFQVRDCTSRAGTRVNGDSISEAVLHDGDVLQMGPFSFRVQLPPDKLPGSAVEARLKHLARSRNNLARLALGYRRRVHQRPRSARPEQELDQNASGLRERVRDYAKRIDQLEEGERALTRDREALLQEKEDVRKHAEHLQQRQQQLDAEVQELEQRRQDLVQQQQDRSREAETVRPDLTLTAANDLLVKQHQALNQFEAALAQQREELMRLLTGLQRLQEPPQTPAATDPHLAAEVENLHAENRLLRQLIEERNAEIEERQHKPEPQPQPAVGIDVETYESELNQYRMQLEADRRKLTAEIEQLRVRNQELDEATRDMEMELSRERAELARERIRLERLRDETRSEVERLQRDAGVRQSLASVQRLRDEMSGGGKK